MTTSFHLSFDKMDEFSQQKIPFFFMIDFLMENIIVLTEEELKYSKIRFNCNGISKNNPKNSFKGDIEWRIHPESLHSYEKGFNNFQRNLKFGNTYLGNYTRKTKIETNLTLADIYALSKAKYKLLEEDNFVVFSPETFVEIKENKIFTHPMKGTIDASIPNAENILKENIKEKAEHYTVVDLLRNDLSIIADNVNVDVFQRIDYIQTKQKNLLAMSSEISGTIKSEFENKIGSILKNILPAGSILGAPKQKTLEITLESECYDRGFYCGVFGWFDGKNLDSGVMIRFIEQNSEGEMFFKSGGGITHMSKLKDEYEEMINKIYVPIY